MSQLPVYPNLWRVELDAAGRAFLFESPLHTEQPLVREAQLVVTRRHPSDSFVVTIHERVRKIVFGLQQRIPDEHDRENDDSISSRFDKPVQQLAKFVKTLNEIGFWPDAAHAFLVFYAFVHRSQRPVSDVLNSSNCLGAARQLVVSTFLLLVLALAAKEKERSQDCDYRADSLCPARGLLGPERLAQVANEH